jgi:hypothetical protein
MTVTDEHWTDELEELPPRPRRKLLTPISGALLAVLIAAGGFIGGVLVEKGQGGSSSNPFAAAASRFARAGAGTFAGPGGSSSEGAPTVGQVSSVEGRTLYVTTPGGTVRVKVPVGEAVSKTITTSVHSIHPGENVVVQGTKGKSGAIAATSVRATQGSSSGSGSSSSGGSSVLNQLFGGGTK